MLDWSDMGASAAKDGGDGVRVNVATQADLLADLDRRLDAGHGFTVATLNLDHVVKLGRDPAFCRAYRAHSHVTADGNPIVWLSRLAGQRVDLVPGSELIGPLAQLAAQKDIPVAFLGSTADTLDRAAEVLVARHPGLRVVARIAPPMGFDPEGAEIGPCLDRIARSGARLCLLALGAPKQEIFAARAQDRLPGVGFVSIGAGLDFLSGRQVRAPRLLRRLALEWLWRLAMNPRRLAARYGACFAVLPQAFGQALKSRQAQGRG
ncbi:exopolysaccharide biosynthesis WecB/TagA/CpsF family protein [Cereibacter ovatus]|uniref:Exopolysaccharide biosynthesis WecB/TagA/CpsF family protein n=1 Tax=Cereibacter ovatus TaxID=439529 RepID=A0A285D3J8_9RHOB|nr:WecB/TagA/CpsF family glycosyltransferase [Cereibacter ovatus]SNX74265.1 exopolysaccharide biosynthesis WecB/TagA/CpsF family protein [Cereibacter ovatus]